MLFVCSVFDKVKDRSVFITMNETSDDAIRDFIRSVSNPHLKEVKNDLVLYHIGYFDVNNLILTPLEITILKEGCDIETVE